MHLWQQWQPEFSQLIRSVSALHIRTIRIMLLIFTKGLKLCWISLGSWMNSLFLCNVDDHCSLYDIYSVILKSSLWSLFAKTYYLAEKKNPLLSDWFLTDYIRFSSRISLCFAAVIFTLHSYNAMFASPWFILGMKCLWWFAV